MAQIIEIGSRRDVPAEYFHDLSHAQLSCWTLELRMAQIIEVGSRREAELGLIKSLTNSKI